MKNKKKLFTMLICPNCKSDFKTTDNGLHCVLCVRTFEIIGGKPFFVAPPKNITVNLKGDNYNSWSTWRKENYIFFDKELSKDPEDTNVLDLGAGPVQFRKIFNKFDNYVALDFYPYELVDVVTDINKNLPFKDSSFDVVVLSNVLEHVPEPGLIISECHRVLRPGGKIVLTIPFLMRIHQAPYDYNRFTSYKLELLLKEAGFNSISIDSLDSTYNLYSMMRGHFFDVLFKTKFSDNKVLNFLYKNIAKILQKIFIIIHFIFRPILSKAGKTKDFTSGYGIVSKK